MTTTAIAPAIGRPRDLARAAPFTAILVLAIVGVAMRRVGGFPSNWNINLADPIDSAHDWVRDNQFTHPLFTWFLGPFSDFIDWSLDSLTEQLEALPWFALPLVSFVPERGKLLPRRMFGTCAEHQRKVTLAIKRARAIALLPYAAE